MTKAAEHETLQQIAEKHASGKVSEADAKKAVEQVIRQTVEAESAVRVAIRELFPSLIKTYR